ncbi:peptidase [Chryseobacterium shandongense]|uniref:Peptidase n=1 Tax=Chryseobacterium shandongense TaxID=1493872 RepID=A0AAD0YCP7_9FLAO|nr:murein L,D-transpeptidase catalytic domain family protein [Chryseobacterium shandongense]AZA86500.1 peptidase [Chryseobacterium shandongense]AZA94908.1 peptidase [Chryseobacterium shandongense]
MRKLFYLGIILLYASLSCQKEAQQSFSGSLLNEQGTSAGKPDTDLIKIRQKAREALQFCKNKKMNTDFCILIDMSIHSGLKRFFLWDFKKDMITASYLVGHGCGNNRWSSDESKDKPQFSNEDGSHLSSLGKYKLEGRGYSNWGINVKYLMHGMENTNSNALKRVIVFHSWELMSDEETFPEGSPEGWGCPTISNNAMKRVDPILQQSKTPVLMWIYN